VFSPGWCSRKRVFSLWVVPPPAGGVFLPGKGVLLRAPLFLKKKRRKVFPPKTPGCGGITPKIFLATLFLSARKRFPPRFPLRGFNPFGGPLKTFPPREGSPPIWVTNLPKVFRGVFWSQKKPSLIKIPPP